MKGLWTHDEIEAEWRVLPEEEALHMDERGTPRLGFLDLRKFQHENRFPSIPKKLPPTDLVCIAGMPEVDPGAQTN